MLKTSKARVRSSLIHAQHLRTWWMFVCVISVVCVGVLITNCSDPQKDEARHVLEAFQHVETLSASSDHITTSNHNNRSHTAILQRLRALEALPLQTPALRELRAHCVQMHRALVAAQAASARAAALAQQREHMAQPGPTVVGQHAIDALRRATAATERAETASHQCLPRLHALRARASASSSSLAP